MADSEIREEPIFGLSPFGKSASLKGVNAVAARIQNLILMEKGTVRERFDMGVGIGRHIFQILTDSEMISLQLEIESQIREYLPDVPLRGVTLRPMTGENAKAVEIEISLSSEIDGFSRLSIRVDTSQRRGVRTEIFVSAS